MSRLVVGEGVALKTRAWTRGLTPSRKITLVSEPIVFRLHGRKVAAALKKQGLDVTVFLLPSSEKAKAWTEAGRLLGAMVRARMGRDSAVAALGGGAVTDVAGFAASVFLRGIPWVSLPTTLLGQLDGGIGGKTAVNLPEGKNLAGSFHQPRVVLCDTVFLKTLPPRERVSGLAEALKYGLVFDPAFFKMLRRDWADLVSGRKAAAAVVKRGASWKVRVVAKDERETRGPRELLNFGHTFGHALEKVAGYGTLRHGEAVLWGMRAALALSVSSAGLSGRAARDADDFLKTIRIPRIKGLTPRRLLDAARTDKKARRGRLRFVLLKALGRPVVRGGIPDGRILKAIEAALKS